MQINICGYRSSPITPGLERAPEIEPLDKAARETV